MQTPDRHPSFIHRPLTSAVFGLLLAASLSAAHAQTPSAHLQLAPDAVNSPYVIDASRTLVRSGTGLCVRTGYWTAESAAVTRVVGSTKPAGCFCDEGLMSRAVCADPAPPVAVKTPEAMPPVVVPPVVVPPPPPVLAEKVSIPADALFDFDKAGLSGNGKAVLDDLLGKLKDLNLEAVVAVGYTDRIGRTDYNLDLSQKRAATVKAYLADTGGIDASRVFIEGRGETSPVTADSCKQMGKEQASNRKLVACLAPDRRVDIEAVGVRKSR
jgi:OmpA-OmpF porin, OOP family